uniref:Nucleotide-diphospho-sugar transferase domain-containing protein n=1 Tax=viral metagenome TaxID=1070528 RepID=A0A6C0BTM6_9ZZZZ
MSNFIIGSGWFSDEHNKTDMGKETNKFQLKYGGTAGRNSNFSKYWLSHILNQSILPKKIVILDADSPQEIDINVKNHKLVEISKQLRNFGHGVYCANHNILCGWARGFLYGAMQSYLNDCDYVYVEQDLLLFGKNFLENIFKLLESNNKEICCMNGDETPQKLQQSLIIVKHSYLIKYITGLLNYNDNTISEELKHYNIIKDDVMWCPYRGGRQRVKLDHENYCLQHLTNKELDSIINSNKLINIF